MVQKVLVEMVDDIDGEIATQTLPFSLDGVSYEIDLSDDNAAALRGELDRYIAASRRVGGRKIHLATGQSASDTNMDGQRVHQIREWALKNGYKVSARGRIPLEILDAYEQPAKTSRMRVSR
jgi:hypothetical protein